MKIVVQESVALKELVEALLRDGDPDYPMTFNSGLSVTLDRQVRKILNIASSEQRRFSNPFIEYHVDQIRRDGILNHLLMVPWSDYKVVDNQGTIVFILKD